ncbi:urea amidolyase family protein [Nocardioides albertanoniae]|uniref:5-oxoprolinase subunit B/C family protein n=1 Tax=Nocardioides albertanoniae TaxID=1175486 RepID=UPI001FE72E47|nr:urea amidolyase family protein [Nocardioides albertanoniae]
MLTASETSLLVEEADLDASMRLHAALVADPLAGVVELVPAARTVLVRFDRTLVDAATLTRQLHAVEPVHGGPEEAGSVRIGVRYDGQDLDDVASLLGITAEQVAARHTAATWQVAFTGYAPGFGYLVGDDPIFDVPRRSSPRTRIPAGSVGLAGTFSGIYPRESPGGWQLIGRTDAAMWDLDRDPPALLVPGTTVHFEQLERESVTVEPSAVSSERSGPAAPAEHEHPFAVEVVRPGLQLVLQDLGRPGHAALGVSASGAADRRALRAANRAVGNAPDAAAFEIAGGGAVLRFTGAAVVAVTGAPAETTIERSDGPELLVEHGAATAVEHGDELWLGPLSTGLRTVLAVRGGLDLPPALGSLSSDTLAGLGPGDLGGRPLRPGDLVPLHGPAAAPYAVDPCPAPAEPLPAAGETVELRIVLGPREDWFTDAGVRTLLEQDWTITPRSDRVGVRLEGAVPLERAVTGELPSEGAVTGAIQVPPDGQPVLFLPDHPLTGGYPIIGAVIDRDLDLAGQLPPGVHIRFRTVASAAEIRGD